jgi:hypothetical protein
MSEYGSDSRTLQAAHAATAAPPRLVDPTALTVEQTAQLLTAAGARHADVETIRRHIAGGAPVSAEGKVNLVHYMAWLMREVSHGEE